VKLRKCAHEAYSMLSKAFGTDTMKKSNVFERHKRLKDDWLNVEFTEGSGRKKTHKNR
jgi:hypothetical protein